MVMFVAEQTEEKNFRFRMDGERKKKWLALCTEKKIKQQEAIEALLDFIFEQDETVQSMLLGQVKARPDLIEVVLRRLSHGQEAAFKKRLGRAERSGRGAEPPHGEAKEPPRPGPQGPAR